MPGARVSGIGGLDAVDLTLSTGEASARVYLHGATVTSFCVEGKELLFVSEQAVFDGKRPIRGGVPLVFPQFGPGALPQHGFVRTAQWECVSICEEDEVVQVELRLADSSDTRALWPHAFELTYTLTLKPHCLELELKVANTGDAPFAFQALQHTYLRTRIDRARITGLRGARYLDKLRDMGEFVEERDVVAIGEETDRIYAHAPHTITVAPAGADKVDVQWWAGAVDAESSEKADVVVWNPWVDKAKQMGDFGDDEYKRMVCVEPGYVSQHRELPAGGAWVLWQRISA